MCNVEQLLCNVDILSTLFLIMIGYDLMCRGRRGMSARLRLNAPWLENCVRQDCDISHSECANILVYRMHVTRV